MSKSIEHKEVSPHIFSLRFWVRETKPEILKKIFDKYLKLTDFKVLNFSEHFFPVHGYTAIWLLAESHLAIHTFETNGWAYIELSGCNKEKTQAFKKLIEQSGMDFTWESDGLSHSFPVEIESNLSEVNN